VPRGGENPIESSNLILNIVGRHDPPEHWFQVHSQGSKVTETLTSGAKSIHIEAGGCTQI